MSDTGTASSSLHRIEIDGGPVFDVAADEDCLLRGALRAGVGFPHECSVGGCGGCRFDLLEGEMETLWPQAPGLSERDRKRGKRLACQSRPLGNCRIKVRSDEAYRPPVSPRRMRATLLECRRITPDMSEFTLELPEPATFLPGQYALVVPPGVGSARAYSMSNLPQGDGRWQFVIRRVPGGQGSGALFDHLAPGDSVTVDGPYGHAYLRPGLRDVVCIAGGSGLGPMLSVARGVLAEGGSRAVHFFHGMRSQADLGAMEELDRLAGDRLTATAVLSDPRPEVPWHGVTGFVHAEVERTLAPGLDRFDFYFAGPPKMVEAVQEMLMLRHRVPFEQVHFDRFL
jgi:toluene monooxygenase electron transfer component